MSGVVMALQKRELQCALNTWADWTGGQLSAVGALYAACKALQQRELRRAVSTWSVAAELAFDARSRLAIVLRTLSSGGRLIRCVFYELRAFTSSVLLIAEIICIESMMPESPNEEFRNAACVQIELMPFANCIRSFFVGLPGSMAF